MTTRESITNRNKRCCLCLHSIARCIPNPPVVRKIQRRGLRSQRTGVGDDLDVGIDLEVTYKQLLNTLNSFLELCVDVLAILVVLTPGNLAVI